MAGQKGRAGGAPAAPRKRAPTQSDPGAHERQRLAALHSYRILDTGAENAFDDVTQLAARLCQAPIALISLIDDCRQWFKSRVGIDVSETPREISFCTHSIRHAGLTIVADARLDERFRDNPLVTGPPHIRFYAACPLLSPDGHALGTLCVVDYVPRQLGDAQLRALRVLSEHVMAQLELRRALAESNGGGNGATGVERVLDALERARAPADADRLADANARLASEAAQRMRLQHEHERTASLLRATLEATADGLLVVDREGAMCSCNQRFARMWGVPAAQQDVPGDCTLLDSVFDQLAEPATLTFRATLRRLEADAEAESFDVLRLRDGRVVEAYSHPQRQSGAAVGRVWSFRDATERVQAARALSESEANLAAAQRITRCGSWMLELADLDDVNRNPLRWSDEVFRIFGYEPGAIEVSNANFYRSVHPDDRARVSDAVDRTVLHGEPYDLDHRIVLPDGSERIVHEQSEVVRDPQTGKPLRMVGTVQDVTERKRAEAALRASEQRFLATFEQAIVGMALHDSAMRRIKVNRRLCEMLGYSEQELTGMPPEAAQLTFPEDRAGQQERLARLFSGAVPSYQVERRYRRKDGSPLWVEVSVSLVEAPGQQRHVLVLAHDLSDRKRAEAALRASEEMFRATFEQATVGIAHRDPQGRWIRVNQKLCDMLGYSREEILAEPMFDPTHPDDRAEIERHTNLLLQGKVTTFTREKRVIVRSGAVGWVLVTVSLVRKPSGMPDYSILVVQDISDRKRAEAALRASEEELRAAFDQATIGISLLTLEGRRLRVNQKLCDFLGYTREELMPLDVSEITHPAERALADDVLRRLREGEMSSYTRDKRYLHKDGETVIGRMTLTVVRDAAGVPGGLLSMVEDVTDRVHTENALRESEQRFRAAFEQAAVGMALSGADGRWLRVNQRLCDILGYSRDDLAQMTSVDVTHPDEREQALEYRRRLAAGELTVYSRDKRYLHKDGRTVWATVSVSVIAGNDRAPALMIAAVEDITDRKNAERALRESEARNRLLATIVNQTNDAVMAKDLDNVITIWNGGAQRLFGYTAREAIGRQVSDLIDARKTPQSVAAALERLRARRTESWEGWRRTKDGRDLYVEISVSPMYDDSGRHVGEISVTRDITARMRAEAKAHQLNTELELRVRQRTAELEASNRELESFSYSIAHDLRAPLRAMDGFSVALLEENADTLRPQSKQYLARIREAAQRMAELIDALLLLSRTTRMEMSREPVDLSALSREICADLVLTGRERQVEFSIAPQVTVVGDPRLLRIVLENLLGNAWKFTARTAAARIEFAASKQGPDRLVCVVRDNGPGFDMAYAGKLFKTFQRLHGAAEFPGTGIGLATVKRVIERHGGEVWAEAEPGNGAAFFFELPA